MHWWGVFRCGPLLSAGTASASGYQDVSHEGVATGRRDFSLPSHDILLRGLQTRAVPANVFGGSSNRNGFRWDEQCAVPDPGVNGPPLQTTNEGNTRRLLEKENRFFCVRCISKKLSLSCGNSGQSETPQNDSSRRLTGHPRKA